MKKIKKGVATLLLAGMISSSMYACAIEVEDGSNSDETSETTESIDFSSIRPQDDFYGYVNGEYLSNIDELYYQNDAGAFGLLSFNNQEILEARLREIVTSTEDYEYGSKEQRLRDAYNQYIESDDDEEFEASLVAEIESVIDEIMNASDIDSLVETMFSIQNNYSCCNDIIHLAVANNDLDPNNYSIQVSFITEVCGVTIEDIDYWQNYVSRIEDPVSDYLTVAGVEADTADEYARDLAGLALEITWASNAELASASNYYEFEEFLSYEELETIFTNVDCHRIEELSGITNNPYGGWITYDREQFQAVNDIFADENLNALKAWLVYSVVNTYDYLLVTDHPILENYVVEDPRAVEDRALDFIQSGYFTDDISSVYTEATYTPEMEAKLRTMCEDIREGYRNVISGAEWLSEETRQGLLTKLDNIVFLTGADVDTTAINTALSDAMGVNTWETIKGIASYNRQQELSNIGKDFDRLVPGMPMDMVNACYNPNNTVTITVAIMGAPFFDVNADYYTNLGGLGAVIAHEVGHAFDSNCIEFDSNGMYNPEWISDSDREALEARNQEAIHYFETAFAVYDVYYVDGEQTLGENYADLGGMEVVTSLCNNREELETLLLNYATIWSELITTDGLVAQLDVDVHSPSVIRVNAILATLDIFYEMYEVGEDDGMYVAPENRIGRWY